MNILTLKAFDKAVLAIADGGKKLDTLIHGTAIAGLNIYHDSGDARHFVRLREALPRGYRRLAFDFWLESFSPIVLDGKGGVRIRKPEDKGYVALNIEGADANPFWDYSEEKKLGTLSLNTLMGVLKRALEDADKADQLGMVVEDGVAKKQIKGNIVEFKAKAARALAVLANAEGNVAAA